eukprot:COSAG04_NODE_3350_length_2903_cov_1.512482_1_plen_313_part_10
MDMGRISGVFSGSAWAHLIQAASSGNLPAPRTPGPLPNRSNQPAPSPEKKKIQRGQTNAIQGLLAGWGGSVGAQMVTFIALLCLPTAASAFGGVRLEELEAIAAELGAAASPCDAPSNPCGEALYLSPLIASDPAKARQASEVIGLAHFEGSHSGLITVGEASGNALFFWFLPAQRPTAASDAPPTIMWLQGGPGAPSTYGMFTEIGPVIVAPNGTLSPRPHTWNAKYNLLIVDNPAGVGFSQLGDATQPVRTEEQVGLEMTEFLRQFSLLFPELRAETAGIFIAGESCTPPQPPLSHARVPKSPAAAQDRRH